MSRFNSYAERDPYDDFLAWDRAQEEAEREARRNAEREEARLEAWEASHEGRLD